MDFVLCKEVVRLSEGPLWEVPLYDAYSDLAIAQCRDSIQEQAYGDAQTP